MAKGVRVPAGALHVCYCFTPMRYVWDLYDDYFGPRARAGDAARSCRRWRRRSGAGTGAPRPACTTSWRSRASSPTASAAPTAGRRRDLPAGRRRRASAIDGVAGRLLPGRVGAWRRTSASTWRSRRPTGSAAASSSSAPGPRRRRLRALAGPTVEFLGWRDDAEVAGALRALPRAALPRARGFRHHAARGHGRGPAGDRARAGRRARDGGAAGRRRAADRPLLRARRRSRTLVGAIRRFEAGAGRFEPEGPARAAPRPSTARSSRSASSATCAPRLRRSAAGAEGALAAPRAADARGRPPARRRLLAARLRRPLLRAGPAAPERHPAARAATCCMLLPILVVWGVAFRAFDLYRPRRIGSHLSEVADVAKASTAGRPRPRRGHDLLLPRVRLLARRHRRTSGCCLDRGGRPLARRLPRGAPLRAPPRLQPALRRGGRRRRAGRRAWCSGCAARPDVGHPGARRGGRRQGGAAAARAGSAAIADLRAVLDAHAGGPRHPRARPRGLRAARAGCSRRSATSR